MPVSRRAFLKGFAASIPVIGTAGWAHGCSGSSELQTRLIGPGSYGNCDPQDALPYVANLEVDFRIIDPGVVIRLPAS